MMNIIFDLSEVLIHGLFGIEDDICALTGCGKGSVMPRFWGENLHGLLLGSRSENAYLEAIIEQEGFACRPGELRAVLQKNFCRQVPGTVPLLAELATLHTLFLFSDHAREWIDYIRAQYPWFERFKAASYSFELGGIKRDPAIFRKFLELHELSVSEAIFIDDNPANIQSARACGIRSIHFTGAPQLRDDLQAAGLLPADAGTASQARVVAG